MPNRVLIIDTSVLCCWLRIPDKETAGPSDDRWDHDRVETLLAEERQCGSTFVLPIATLIETGNHIAQSPRDRFELATRLAGHLRASAVAESPWAAFADQADLWDPEHLRQLAEDWPALAAGQLTIGDATIKAVAEFYASAGMHVQIITGDAGLKAYEPAAPPPIPRRRR